MLFFTQCKVYFYPKVAALGEEDQKTSVPVCGGGVGGGGVVDERARSWALQQTRKEWGIE